MIKNSSTPLNKKKPNSKNQSQDQISWEYKKRAIQSASNMQLILMLYEEAIKCLEEAKGYSDSYKTYDFFNQRLLKAVDIVKELRISLDMSQGQIAENLSNLYDYLETSLKQTALDKKTEPIDRAINILNSLLGSWKQVESLGNKQAVSQHQSQESDLKKHEGGFSIKG